MATFVLVHGGWHGAWCWERLTPLLTHAGHTVIAPDLPGHGDDLMPLSARPYEQYVPSISAVVAAQPEPVILLGHSSGGMIISAVAAAHPKRVQVLVYLAAFLLPPGVSPPMILRDDHESLLGSALVIDREGQTTTVPPEAARAVFYADCTEADAAWAIRRLQPEPIVPTAPTPVTTPTDDPAILTMPDVPRVYIETLHDKALGPATQRRMYTALSCAHLYTLPTGHSPFISAPLALAAQLQEIAGQQAIGSKQ